MKDAIGFGTGSVPYSVRRRNSRSKRLRPAPDPVTQLNVKRLK